MPHFYFQCYLLTHDIRSCITMSGLNVSFNGRHANYEDWLIFDLNLNTSMYVKGDARVCASLSNEENVGSNIFVVVQKDMDVDVSHLIQGNGQRVVVEDLVCTSDSTNTLNVIIGDLVQTRKGNEHG